MLSRLGTWRSVWRRLSMTSAGSIRPANRMGTQSPLASRHRTWTEKPVVPALAPRTFTTSLTRREPDLKAEAEIRKQKLPTTPETVTTSSTTHPVFHEVGKADSPPDIDMMKSIRADLGAVQDTFSLKAVPRDAMYLGLAGVLPYLATSLGTVYAGYEIKASAESGLGFFLHEQQAQALLQALEPLQVGYGAVILSFLGAIHWGMEWAGYGGRRSHQRYAIGVIAPAVAWPTLLLPTQEALVAQFVAFTFLYNADSNAASRGLAPPWYGTYRFVLSFIVGASVIVTLIGRSHAGAQSDQVPGPIQRAEAFQEIGAKGSEKKQLEKEEEEEQAAEPTAKAAANEDTQ